MTTPFLSAYRLGKLEFCIEMITELVFPSLLMCQTSSGLTWANHFKDAKTIHTLHWLKWGEHKRLWWKPQKTTCENEVRSRVELHAMTHFKLFWALCGEILGAAICGTIVQFSALFLLFEWKLPYFSVDFGFLNYKYMDITN